MADLVTIPMQDDFETTLQSTWSGGTGSVTVNSVPTATILSGKYSYIVVNPGESNMQVAKIDGWNGGTKTFNVTSVAVRKGAGIDYTTQSHAAGAIVRFSNNYAFWEDMLTAINSKADKTQLGSLTITAGLIDSSTPMSFKDNTTAVVTLAQLATGGGADQKVAITSNDTTTGVLDTKLTAGDGLKKTVVNPGGNESLDLDIDTADTTTFVKTSTGATDENKVAVLNASGKVAAGFLDMTNIYTKTEVHDQIKASIDVPGGSYSLGTNYQVTTSGFIVGYIKKTGGNVANCYIGSASPASILVLKSGSDLQAMYGGFCFPVPKDYYFRIDGPSSPDEVLIKFVPNK